jgi:hypothetical protein
MQKEAWLSVAAAAVFGSFGLFVRWLQLLNVFEADTGLARPGSFLNWAVALLCIAAAAVFLFQVRRLRRYQAPTEPAAAFYSRKQPFQMLMLVSGVLAAAGAVLMFRQGDLLTKILALLGLLAAACLAFYPEAKSRGELGCLIAAVPVLFFCFWLIVSYKENADDPVLWDYAIEILAIASSSLAFYYMAGYLFYRAKPMRTVYFVLLAAFFCTMTLVDRRGLGASLILAASGLSFFVLGWILIRNLRPKEQPK